MDKLLRDIADILRTWNDGAAEHYGLFIGPETGPKEIYVIQQFNLDTNKLVSTGKLPDKYPHVRVDWLGSNEPAPYAEGVEALQIELTVARRESQSRTEVYNEQQYLNLPALRKLILNLAGKGYRVQGNIGLTPFQGASQDKIFGVIAQLTILN